MLVMKKGETNPNDFIEHENYIELLINSRGKQYSCLVDKDDYDNPEIHKHRWTINSPKYKYVVRGQWDGAGYKMIRLSRLLCGRVVLTNEVVDHINGNALDNRRKNLRILSQHENTRNRTKIRNKTGVPGAMFSSNGSISVTIRHKKGKTKYVGSYKTKAEALKARIEAEKKYWGHSYLEEKCYNKSNYHQF